MTFNVTTKINQQIVSREQILAKELERSRVALLLLKEKLGADNIRELLAEDCAEMAELLRQWSKNSTTYKPSITLLEVEDLSKEEFLGWFHQINQDNQQAKLLGAMPEHYLIEPKDNSQELIETMGLYGKPVHCQLIFADPEQADIPLDPDYETQMFVKGVHIDNGEDIHIRALHEFKNTATGMQVKLGIYFPEHTPDEMVTGHQWHLAIEFNNWLEQAKADLGK
ncbi:hypothetical protein [Volucribacter amazonae]|uniref:Uncharacterized protein n=1 Tax=Volucribacter amazonae TaxID=256731 RepID=A0A9X4SR64_9PAST|nr:hypothetical protein [Volucribacter amazonae]MDG6896246.1 hypothetical protein [Volucribacter amazonae]